MPTGRHKSGSMRKLKIKTPSGKVVTHYRRKNPSPAQCGRCGKNLAAVPRLRPFKMKTTAKTKKRPERPYGGVLCSGCSRSLIKEEVKNMKV